MTLRHKLADLISGGALSKLKDMCRFEAKRHDETVEKLERAMQAVEWWIKNSENLRASMFDAIDDSVRLDAALEQIAAMETPGANATVRRMAAKAREALK